MARYGMLIEYDYCTGCHSCEVACQQEHDYPVGKNGIKITEFEYEVSDRIKVDYMPYFTDLCDMCAKRGSAGELPSCVKHCQSKCMKFGQVDELAKEIGNQPKMVLFSPF
ncbi:oxidoreductase [Thermodesulfobacteriota bacterium]